MRASLSILCDEDEDSKNTKQEEELGIALLSYNEINSLRSNLELNQKKAYERFLEKRVALNKVKNEFIENKNLNKSSCSEDRGYKQDLLDEFQYITYLPALKSNRNDYLNTIKSLSDQAVSNIDERNDNYGSGEKYFSEIFILPKYNDKLINVGDRDTVVRYCQEKGFNSGKIQKEAPLYFKCYTSTNNKERRWRKDEWSFDIKTLSIKNSSEYFSYFCIPVLSNSEFDKDELSKETDRAKDMILKSNMKINDRNQYDLNYIDLHSKLKNALSYTLNGFSLAFNASDKAATKLFYTKKGYNIDGLPNEADRSSRGALFNMQKSDYSISVHSFYVKRDKDIVKTIKCANEQTIREQVEAEQEKVRAQLNAIDENYKDSFVPMDTNRKRSNVEVR